MFGRPEHRRLQFLHRPFTLEKSVGAVPQWVVGACYTAEQPRWHSNIMGIMNAGQNIIHGNLF